MTTRRETLRWSAGVLAFYLLLAVALTWPLVTEMGSVFVGAAEGDAYEYARHSWWYGFALRNGYPVFEHPLLAYPDGLAGRWLWAIPLQSIPVWPLSELMPQPVAYNLVALARLALNGWAAAYLVRRLLSGAYGGDRLTPYPGAAALLAGAVFATLPAAQGHLFGSHIGILALWPVPLAVDAMLRLRAGGGGPLVYLRAGVLVALSGLGSLMSLVFALAPFAVALVISELVGRRWRALMRVLGGLAVGAALVSLFAVPAVIEQLTDASAVRPGGVVRFSADLLAVASPSFLRPGAPDWSARVLGTNIVEGFGYVGLVAGGAAFRVDRARRVGAGAGSAVESVRHPRDVHRRRARELRAVAIRGAAGTPGAGHHPHAGAL